MTLKHDLQHYLNLQLSECALDDHDIESCGYHASRAITVPARFDPIKIAENSCTAFLPAEEKFKSIIRMFSTDCPPAGGWFLVAEQRQWLASIISKIISAKDSPSHLRILEAGIAGFVHHYTYMQILEECLESQIDVEIALSVLDKCVFPIEQIRAIEKYWWADGLMPDKLDVGGLSLTIHPDVRELISARHSDRLSLDAHVINMQTDDFSSLGPIDIVTDHFLTSVLDADIVVVEQIWANCIKAMAADAHFLCAVGTTPGEPAMQKYMEIAERLGLRLITQDTKQVWDPYGLDRQELLHLLGQGAEGMAVALDNSLLHFQRI